MRNTPNYTNQYQSQYYYKGDYKEKEMVNLSPHLSFELVIDCVLKLRKREVYQRGS